MEKKDKDMKKILLSLLLVVTLAVPLPAFAETTGAESQTGAEVQTEAPSSTSFLFLANLASPFAEKVGLAFQLQYDYLDAFGDPALF